MASGYSKFLKAYLVKREPSQQLRIFRAKTSFQETHKSWRGCFFSNQSDGSVFSAREMYRHRNEKSTAAKGACSSHALEFLYLPSSPNCAALFMIQLEHHFLQEVFPYTILSSGCHNHSVSVHPQHPALSPVLICIILHCNYIICSDVCLPP